MPYLFYNNLITGKMKSFKVLTISVLMLVSLSFSSTAQQNYASNVHTSILSDNVIISYDILPKDGSRFFDIVVMVTHHGRQVEAKSIYGDYGTKVEPGAEKNIVWYFGNDFEGKISEVEIDIFAYRMNEPKAIFEVISLSNNGFAPCEITINNRSEFANEYRWDFGNPSSGIKNQSREITPRHTYEKGGAYTVTLVARNSALNMESTFYQSFEIKEHPPTIAGFNFEIRGTKPPFEVRFSQTSTNADQFAWNFGDPSASAKNNSSNKPNPSYKYKQYGTYTVELEAGSSVSKLSDKLTKTITIQAPELPSAAFVFTLSAESAPVIAVFKNTSSNASEWQWNFGDPLSGSQNVSTEANPAHKYENPGKYEVTLTATDPASRKSSKTSSVITVAAPPKAPVAGFKIENNNKIGPVTVIFTNTSTDSNRFSWDFGDPESGQQNSSDEQSPVHTYTKPGRYAVNLTAVNTRTGEISTYLDYVMVAEPARGPVAGFTIDNNHAESPAIIRFTNTSANAELYSWDFGDEASGAQNRSADANPSHTYSQPGKYQVVLTAINKTTGVSSRFTGEVSVSEAVKPPVAKFDIANNNAIAPAMVSFSNLSESAASFEWNFGDSSAGEKNFSNEKNPSHTYAQPGLYKVTLKATNTATKKFSTIENTVVVREREISPVADFSFEIRGQSAPLEIAFTNASANADQLIWNFGDGKSKSNTSPAPNPVHRYESPGTYKITLVAKNSKTGASATISKEIVVSRKFPTFAQVFGKPGSDEMARSIQKVAGNGFFVLVDEGKQGATVLKLDSDGNRVSEKKISSNATGIASLPDEKGYVITGLMSPSEIKIQFCDSELNPGNPQLIHTNINNPGASFSLARVAVSAKGNIGVAANMQASGEPYDIWFQMADKSGKPVAPQVKVFKYVGSKTVHSVLPYEDGFMVTGFWQQDQNALKRMMLGFVDASGKGEMNVLRSQVNMTGCDMIVLPDGKLSVLAAKDCFDDKSFSDISLVLVDRKIAPQNCEIDLPGRMKTSDMQKFPPRVIKNQDGYVVLSHNHNGNNSNLVLYWIDNTGRTLIRKEELVKPGDQFGTDLVFAEDGGLLIAGAEWNGKNFDTLLIKTDPYGKVYELADK
jgi:PKD repeat protein